MLRVLVILDPVSQHAITATISDTVVKRGDLIITGNVPGRVSKQLYLLSHMPFFQKE